MFSRTSSSDLRMDTTNETTFAFKNFLLHYSYRIKTILCWKLEWYVARPERMIIETNGTCPLSWHCICVFICLFVCSFFSWQMSNKTRLPALDGSKRDAKSSTTGTGAPTKQGNSKMIDPSDPRRGHMSKMKFPNISDTYLYSQQVRSFMGDAWFVLNVGEGSGYNPTKKLGRLARKMVMTFVGDIYIYFS